MDRVALVPVLLSHANEGLVSEDASIVDNDMNSAKSVDCSLDDLVALFY